MTINRKIIVRLIFYGIILLPALFLLYISFWGLLPDFRFGPDIRFSSKIIDPDEAGFNPDDFLFDDYNNYEDVVYVLSKMFPEGTDETVILQKIKDDFGQKEATEIQVVDKLHSQSAELPSLDHKIFTRYRKIYPLRRCLISSAGDADAIEYLFNDRNKLTGIRVMSGCIKIGKVYVND